MLQGGEKPTLWPLISVLACSVVFFPESSFFFVFVRLSRVSHINNYFCISYDIITCSFFRTATSVREAVLKASVLIGLESKK